MFCLYPRTVIKLKIKCFSIKGNCIKVKAKINYRRTIFLGYQKLKFFLLYELQHLQLYIF